MKKVLVAGATGYLGKYVVNAFKEKGYFVRALARKEKSLDDVKDSIDEIVIGQVTKPETIKNICENIDIVFSSVGITRQKDGLTYNDVDYQGNRNLLDFAQENNVNKFVYVSVFNAELMKNLVGIKAKLKFVEDLKQSGIDYSIIEPTGFFSDMGEILNMAKKGKIQLFGDGSNRINPIHGKDLAEVCTMSIEKPNSVIEVGGPQIFTYKGIAEIAFKTLNKPVKISFTPIWVIKLILGIMRNLTPSKTYGPMEFMMTVLTNDMVAPVYGKEKLEDFYRKCINEIE